MTIKPSYPVTDANGHRLWLHTTCGNTQWAPGCTMQMGCADHPDPPKYCDRCSFRTDAWEPVYTEHEVGPIDRSAS